MLAGRQNSSSSHSAHCANDQSKSLPLSLLQRLPTELKRQIIRYVIPHGLTIVFNERFSYAVARWITGIVWIDQTCEPDKVQKSISNPERDETSRAEQHTFVSLIRTSKDLSTEARAMLYSENEFLFHATRPMFGSSCEPISANLLRNIKTIRLVVEKSLTVKKAVTDKRAFFQSFIKSINAHDGHNGQAPSLQQLCIEVRFSAGGSRSRYLFGEGELERCANDPANGRGKMIRALMYTLESLTDLPPIDRVIVTGLPEWFITCLQLCISGRGGAILPLHWQNCWKENSRTGEWYIGSDRPENAPSLDWGKFAKRNNIGLPDCMLQFFKKHSARSPLLSTS